MDHLFHVNDHVVYGATGVCRIVDVVRDGTAGDVTEYYILQSVCENCLTIKTPVENAPARMRQLISPVEIAALIESLPQQETLWIKNGRERNMQFKIALKSGSCETLARLIKTIYLERRERSGGEKKLAKSDEDIFQAAEKQLYGEMAIALNISPADVVAYIHKHVAGDQPA